MKRLEDNYISVVMVVEDKASDIKTIFENAKNALNDTFKNYEIIIVDNASSDNTFEVLKSIEDQLSIIHLPIKHGSQQALNAGTSIAVGDYVVEIESATKNIDFIQIQNLYYKCQEGYDFVFLTPKQTSLTSRIFYSLLNSSFKNQFTANITSTIMTLSSRRGQNKSAEIGGRVINRNVHYVLSGLKSYNIQSDSTHSNNRGIGRNIELMLDTFIHHTNIVTTFSQRLSLMFFVFSLFAIAYAIIARFTINTVSGWASTLVFINLGFSAIFVLFSIVTRYLHHIIQNSIGSKDYIYREIVKKND